jgi:hypothetical protein
VADANNIPMSDARLRAPMALPLPYELRRQPSALEMAAQILEEVQRLREQAATHGDRGDIHRRVTALLTEARIEIALLRQLSLPSPKEPKP